MVKPLVVLALDAHGVRYSSNVNTHAEYQALGGHCITMRTCITVERSDLVTLQVRAVPATDLHVELDTTIACWEGSHMS